MPRPYFASFLVILLICAAPAAVLAHVLQSDGTIGAVMHIDPDDDPIAGQPSNFFFEFKDKQGKFTPTNCTCTATIMQAGKQIYTASLFQNNSGSNLTSAILTFTFPQKDVYQIILSGQPTTPNVFQPFTLTYDIRVARQASQPVPSATTSKSWLTTHTLHIIATIIIIIVLIGLIIHERLPKKS